MRVTVFLLAMMFAAPLALADEAQPKREAVSSRACQFTTNNCERCGFDENGKPWCTPSFFGCTVTSTSCLIEANGTRHTTG